MRFWTTRGRLSVFFLRRATLRQEKYVVLGAYKYTQLAPLDGGVQRNVDKSRGAAVDS